MTLGIDIGGTNLCMGLVKDGKAGKQISVPSFQPDDTLEETLDYLSTHIEGIITPDTGKIGIGVPSVLDIDKGIIYDAINIPSWKEVPLKEYLEKRFSIPVAINNDANCFALGAYATFPDNAKPEVLVGITLGTGVGMGIVDRGVLFCGANGGSGELGSLPYRDGIIEEYCAKKFFISHELEGHKAAKDAENGDPKALAVFDEFGRTLGELLNVVLLAYDPSHIIIGGGIAKAWPLFRKSTESTLKELFPYHKALERLVIQPLCCDDVQLIGASLL